MKLLLRSILLGSLAATAFCAAAPGSNEPLQRLIALDSRLHSYSAHVHADISMHTFPYLSPSLDGMYYYKQPDKNKIVFTSGVPLIAKQFSDVYPKIEPPARWNQVYRISVESQDGSFLTYKLVPKARARVDHIDAKVNKNSGELAEMRWNYVDGGYASLSQNYSRVGGFDVVTQQSGHLQIPYYNADVKSSFSDFKLNANIPDSIFSQ